MRMRRVIFFAAVTLAAQLLTLDIAEAVDAECLKLAKIHMREALSCPTCEGYASRKLRDIRRLIDGTKARCNNPDHVGGRKVVFCEAIDLKGRVTIFYYTHAQNGPQTAAMTCTDRIY